VNLKQSAYYCRRLHQSPQTRNLEQLINAWWDWNLQLKSVKHFLLRTSHIYMMLSNTFAITTSSWIQSSMLSNIEISENLTFVVCFFWTCSVSLDADNCLLHEELIQRGQKTILSQTNLKWNVVNCNHVTHLLMMMMVMSITQCSYYNTKFLMKYLMESI
jgi:hypothetical protein